jgi:hypothetical protein
MLHPTTVRSRHRSLGILWLYYIFIMIVITPVVQSFQRLSPVITQRTTTTNIGTPYTGTSNIQQRSESIMTAIPRNSITSDRRHRHRRTSMVQPLSVFSITNTISVMDQFVQSSPYTTAAIVCGIKASTADFIAQKRQLRQRYSKNNIGSTLTTPANTTYDNNSSTRNIKTLDWLRNISFLIYGSMYQGIAQEYIYNHLYPIYFGTNTNIITVLLKVFFDLFIQTTIITLPIAYTIKAVIYQYTIQEAFARYIEDIRYNGLLTKYFVLWGPIQCITFSIIPEHYRISFIATVSFFWLIILSTISSHTRRITTITETTEDSEPVNTTNTVDTNLSSRCELVDGLTCNIDG